MTPSQLIESVFTEHGGNAYEIGRRAYGDRRNALFCKNRWYRWRLNYEGATLGKLERDLNQLGLGLSLSVKPLRSNTQHTEE